MSFQIENQILSSQLRKENVDKYQKFNSAESVEYFSKSIISSEN